MSKIISICILIYLLTGCTVPWSFDASDKPYAKNMTNQCYQLTNDAFLIQPCEPHPSIADSTLIDPEGFEPHCTPPNISVYNKDPSKWNNICDESKRTLWTIGCRYRVSMALPKGSKFKVTRIINMTGGGPRFWKVSATLVNSKDEFEIFGSWLNPRFFASINPKQNLEILNKYAKACTNY